MTANDITQKIKCRQSQPLVSKTCDEHARSMSVCSIYMQLLWILWGIMLTPKIIWLHPWACWSLIDTLTIFKSFSSSHVLPTAAGKVSCFCWFGDNKYLQFWTLNLWKSGKPACLVPRQSSEVKQLFSTTF